MILWDATASECSLCHGEVIYPHVTVIEGRCIECCDGCYEAISEAVYPEYVEEFVQ